MAGKIMLSALVAPFFNCYKEGNSSLVPRPLLPRSSGLGTRLQYYVRKKSWGVEPAGSKARKLCFLHVNVSVLTNRGERALTSVKLP